MWLHLAGSVLVMVILITALTYSCERSIEQHEKESGKTILQSIGEELGKAKAEFDKGYANDTIK